MSGGVDSSVAAYLLREQGYRVVGITFQLLPEPMKSVESPKTCGSETTILRAKAMAQSLSIPHYVINLRTEFQTFVINKFIEGYAEGKTPNPCILCNKHIKFSAFFNKALSMGADFIATGHYAIVEETSLGYVLEKGMDKTKDQSYFLYSIEADKLSRILFPLGTFSKAGTLSLARHMGWKNLGSYRESQDICFIRDGHYQSFLTSFVPAAPGPIYSVDGTLLGHHEGIHRYTVGQRRGLGIAHKEPLYVIETRPLERSVIVGPKKCLLRKNLTATDVHFLMHDTGTVTGKVRYRQREQPCTYFLRDGKLHVEFQEGIDAVTPGQSVVLYRQETVLGGGIITDNPFSGPF